MASEILDDTFVRVLEVKSGAYFNTVRLQNVHDGIVDDDAVTLRQLKGYVMPLSTVVSSLVSSVDYLLAHGGGGGGSPELWSGYPALSNVNMANSTINSTLSVQLMNGASSLTLNYFTLNNIIDVSTVVSTLSYYNAVEACLIVTNSHNISSVTANVADVSTIVSTLSYYNAVQACLTVTNAHDISTVTANVADVSTIVSTLSYYNAVQACLTVTNAQNISTVKESLAGRQRLAYSTLNVGSYNSGHIVSTVVSTLGWLNTFNNTTGSLGNINLNLSTLAIWPNSQFDCMRFYHTGSVSQCNINVYAESSSAASGLLATIQPGQSYTFIWSGDASATGDARRLSTNYLALNGF
jgi:hypothetical protein